MVYDPNGSNNSSLISLVAGTISFVAGETAKHGDMKVDTPVATMGIRGTAVLVEIDFNVPGENGLPDCEIPGSGRAGRHHRLLHPVRQDDAGSDRNRQQGRAAGQHQSERHQLSKQSADARTAETHQRCVLAEIHRQQQFQHQDFDHFTDSLRPAAVERRSRGWTVCRRRRSSWWYSARARSVRPSNLGAAGHSTFPMRRTPRPQRPFHRTTSASPEATTLDTASGIINFADINDGDQPTASGEFTSFVYQNAHQHRHQPQLDADGTGGGSGGGSRAQCGPGSGATRTTARRPGPIPFPDGSFDFLGAGETLTLTYIATVNNNFAQNTGNRSSAVHDHDHRHQ